MKLSCNPPFFPSASSCIIFIQSASSVLILSILFSFLSCFSLFPHVFSSLPCPLTLCVPSLGTVYLTFSSPLPSLSPRLTLSLFFYFLVFFFFDVFLPTISPFPPATLFSSFWRRTACYSTFTLLASFLPLPSP